MTHDPASPTPTPAVRAWMATIGRKGGQQLTEAKRRQLAAAAKRPRPGRAAKLPITVQVMEARGQFSEIVTRVQASNEQEAVDKLFELAKPGNYYRYLGARGVLEPSSPLAGQHPEEEFGQWYARAPGAPNTPPRLRVLVACEFSGVVRRAFRDAGHDAWSCDLLPAEDGSPQHYQQDVTELLGQSWDLLIAHPPCTYLANSGVRWLDGGRNKERMHAMRQACDFFAALYWASVPRVAIENPIMHCYARDYLARVWQVPDHSQSVQPWQFGHGEVKRTCFWLRGLPCLTPTNVVAGRVARVHQASPGPDRWKERSRTLPGLAVAMAAQWGACGVVGESTSRQSGCHALAARAS